MNIDSSDKIEILKKEGMEINNLDFNQLEFVYDVVINGKKVEKKNEKKQYKKINWNGKSQLNVFLDVINNYKNCKSIKKNNNFTVLNIHSIFNYSNQLFIHPKPKIILKKIKKRCDFILTSDKWLKKDSNFKQIEKNKFIWLGDIDDIESFSELKKICPLVLNDNVYLKKEISNGIF